MTPLRMMASGLAAPVLALLTWSNSLAAQAPGQLLSDTELAATHAAGLSEPALRLSALGAAEPAAMPMPWLESLAHADRQQALSQLHFAAVTAHSTAGLVQGAAVATVAMPLATLFIPSLVLPFPLMVAPPPKKTEPGH